MKLISHRGNLTGPNTRSENNPQYIQNALDLGFEVEVDVRTKGDLIFLGHDYYEYPVDFYWILARADKLWIHCKNLDAFSFFSSRSPEDNPFNYFWHENDAVTMTSKGIPWAYPGKQPILGSIAVLPEIHNDELSQCYGVCTDYVYNYQ